MDLYVTFLMMLQSSTENPAWKCGVFYTEPDFSYNLLKFTQIKFQLQYILICPTIPYGGFHEQYYRTAYV